MGLPRDPDIPQVTEAWQDFAQPIGLGAMGVSILGAGLAAVIARRNHMNEMRALEEAAAGSEGDDDEVTP
jgi:hypothetical protein